MRNGLLILVVWIAMPFLFLLAFLVDFVDVVNAELAKIRAKLRRGQ